MWAKVTEAVKQTTIFCVCFLFIKATHLSLERVTPQLRTGMLWWGDGKIEIKTLYPDVWIEIFYWPGKRHLLILKTMILLFTKQSWSPDSWDQQWTISVCEKSLWLCLQHCKACGLWFQVAYWAVCCCIHCQKDERTFPLITLGKVQKLRSVTKSGEELTDG